MAYAPDEIFLLDVGVIAKSITPSKNGLILFSGNFFFLKIANAFINFFSREDGQRAIDKLDGHGYDHLILSVSWANPSAGGDGPKAAPPTGAAFGPALGSGGPGGGGASRFEGRGSIADRYDKQVFDSGLDRFR